MTTCGDTRDGYPAGSDGEQLSVVHEHHPPETRERAARDRRSCLGVGGGLRAPDATLNWWRPSSLAAAVADVVRWVTEIMHYAAPFGR